MTFLILTNIIYLNSKEQTQHITSYYFNSPEMKYIIATPFLSACEFTKAAMSASEPMLRTGQNSTSTGLCV